VTSPTVSGHSLPDAERTPRAFAQSIIFSVAEEQSTSSKQQVSDHAGFSAGSEKAASKPHDMHEAAPCLWLRKDTALIKPAYGDLMSLVQACSK
jgi:hypothetical protein